MKNKQLLHVAGGCILAGVGLYIFSRDVNPADLWKEMKTTPFWVIGAVALLNAVSLWLRALRWKLILPISPSARRRGLFGLISIGFMVNNILPARLGEAARIFLLWKRNGFTAAESIGSVLIERFLDTIVFSSFFVIPALLTPSLRVTAVFAGIMAAGVVFSISVFVCYSIFPSFVQRQSNILLGLLPSRFRKKGSVICSELISNLDWVFSAKKTCAVAALSLCTVFCHVVMMVILVRDESFGFLGGMFSAACAALGAAIPLSPGYVGTLHAALKQGLVMIGINSATAGATAIVYHAVGYISIIALGIFFFFRMNISFKDIGRARKPLEAEEAGSAS